jgi:hypothetical protein
MGGSGKKARTKANKANKKKGSETEKSPPPPPPPPVAAVPSTSVQRTEEESTYNWAEWLAEEEEDLRSLTDALTGAALRTLTTSLIASGL